MADPLAPFDMALVEDVAAEHGIDPSALAALVERHHAYAARVPGIDELVFEWRRAFSHDPVVARTPDAYHLAVDPTVWAEFAAQLGLVDDDLVALRKIHDRQARRRAAGDDDAAAFGERAPMVLAR